MINEVNSLRILKEGYNNLEVENAVLTRRMQLLDSSLSREMQASSEFRQSLEDKKKQNESCKSEVVVLKEEVSRQKKNKWLWGAGGIMLTLIIRGIAK